MRAFLRDNALSLAFGGLCLGSLVGQAFVGHEVFNADARAHGSETVSLGRYLYSSHYGQAVMENWQSEYLQFSLLILATIWLLQRGSPESDTESGLGTDKEQKIGRFAGTWSPLWARAGGWRTAIYSYSLLIVMGAIFVASWFGQSVTGWTEYNQEQQDHDASTVSWAGYVKTAAFWEDTLQNWQSEFLAVGSMVIFAVYLRARGSPESKPVGAPHDETGGTG